MSDESDLRVGFAVLYRWRLTPGMEATFREGWERVTVQLKQHRGALGSRLHLAEDGTWVAYAQWPSRAAWEAAGNAGFDVEGFGQMQAAIVERFPAVPMQVEVDRLRPPP